MKWEVLDEAVKNYYSDTLLSQTARLPVAGGWLYRERWRDKETNTICMNTVFVLDYEATQRRARMPAVD